MSAIRPKHDSHSTSPLRVRIQMISSQTSDVDNRTYEVVQSIISENDLHLYYLLARRFERKNNPRAVFWYQKAADEGYTQAQYRLGRCYAKGFGVEQNAAQAVIWYQKAADQGYQLAQNKIREAEHYTQTT
jgi:TPR repeat protein